MAHEGLWEQLEKLDREETAKRAKCRRLAEPDRYVLAMLDTRYVVNLINKDISSLGADSSSAGASFLEQLCVLAYLINAKDIALAEKLVKAESLPGGQFFFRGLHSLPTGKLAKAFGDDPKVLIRASARFAAKRCEFGDASIRLSVLPRIPLTIVIWRGDEEFGARASILFDQTAAAQLPLDALWAAVNLTVETLIKTAGVGG
jgi:hypothetical protein